MVHIKEPFSLVFVVGFCCWFVWLGFFGVRAFKFLITPLEYFDLIKSIGYWMSVQYIVFTNQLHMAFPLIAR